MYGIITVRKDGKSIHIKLCNRECQLMEHDLLRPTSEKQAPVEWISEQSRYACTNDDTVTTASRHDTGQIFEVDYCSNA